MPTWLPLAIDSFWPMLSAGLKFTIPLTLSAFILGLTLGFIVALLRLYGPACLKPIVIFYVWLIRGTPLLVQLFLIFYALPSAGVTIDAFPAAVIGFTVNIGAYTSEVIRATLLAVPKSQWEAAHAISMTWAQALRRIILPQAARIAVPPLSNTFISLVKDTSLASVITVPEMFLAAQQIAAVTYEPLILYSEAAVIYLLFSSVLSHLQEKLERKLAGTTVKERANDNALQH
ncbi:MULTISPECIES: amino acid ABC transporter permease [Kosakonia]|uniref:amino acid ABC transporter permease n=1 Tax=Kosakonia TaxID=1330547 RepID=UPI001482D009|nr:amino acid ABC transporter permease [Kosakonia sacchari]